jgi:hypothetical protein
MKLKKKLIKKILKKKQKQIQIKRMRIKLDTKHKSKDIFIFWYFDKEKKGKKGGRRKKFIETQAVIHHLHAWHQQKAHYVTLSMSPQKAAFVFRMTTHAPTIFF